MSAELGVLRRAFAESTATRTSDQASLCEVEPLAAGHDWQPAQYAQDQLRGLVRTVFVPGWPRPARQVVFSAVEPRVDVTSICMRIGEVLATQGAGKVCVVEANFTPQGNFGGTSNDGNEIPETAGAVPLSSRQISRNLWVIPAFFQSEEQAQNVAWLRARLGELRREFDFAVIHAAPVSDPAGVSVLAHLTDGLVLALDAHRTRRATAQRIRQQLLATNVRLLGVILRDRTFPIPERLYRRL
jgi:hypothetical protein